MQKIDEINLCIYIYVFLSPLAQMKFPVLGVKVSLIVEDLGDVVMSRENTNIVKQIFEFLLDSAEHEGGVGLETLGVENDPLNDPTAVTSLRSFHCFSAAVSDPSIVPQILPDRHSRAIVTYMSGTSRTEGTGPEIDTKQAEKEIRVSLIAYLERERELQKVNATIIRAAEDTRISKYLGMCICLDFAELSCCYMCALLFNLSLTRLV